jgi:hypothetical protein
VEVVLGLILLAMSSLVKKLLNYMSTATAKRATIIQGFPSSLPVTSVTIPVGGSTVATGAMSIFARQQGNFIFGISANVVTQMPCFSTGGSNVPWGTQSPNVGRIGGTNTTTLDASAEFVAAAFGKTLNTAFSTALVELANSGTVNSVTGADIYTAPVNIGAIPKPINQFGTLPADPYILDGMTVDNAPHDSLVGYSCTYSGVGSVGIGFAKKTGNTYTDFFFNGDGTVTNIACGVNNLTDATLLLLASALGITPTSAVFATNTGGVQAFQGGLGAWTNTTGGAVSPYILVSLTV